jgi:cytochrome c2
MQSAVKYSISVCILLVFALAAASTPNPAPADKGDPEMGNELFDEQCSMCHQAYSSERKVGPSLKGLFAKDKLESNGKPVNDANVIERIDKGGNGMPPFKDSFSTDDKANLLAYLKKL